MTTARLLQLAPYGAEADVSGDGAEAFVEGLRDARVTISSSRAGFQVRASDVATLTAALRSAPRPHAKVRVAVH